jgi:hypothetical protein
VIAPRALPRGRVDERRSGDLPRERRALPRRADRDHLPNRVRVRGRADRRPRLLHRPPERRRPLHAAQRAARHPRRRAGLLQPSDRQYRSAHDAHVPADGAEQGDAGGGRELHRERLPVSRPGQGHARQSPPDAGRRDLPVLRYGRLPVIAQFTCCAPRRAGAARGCRAAGPASPPLALGTQWVQVRESLQSRAVIGVRRRAARSVRRGNA